MEEAGARRLVSGGEVEGCLGSEEPWKETGDGLVDGGFAGSLPLDLGVVEKFFGGGVQNRTRAERAIAGTETGDGTGG